MGIKGLHHVALAAPDAAIYGRAVAFYRDVLGFPVMKSFSNGPRRITMLDMGNTVLEIVGGVETEAVGPVFHLAVEVDRPDEVDAMLGKCAAAGCAVTVPPSELRRPDETNAGAEVALRNAFCTGPAGERLEFFCEL